MSTETIIRLVGHDAGSPPESKGGLSLNSMGIWYKVDDGEWRICKRKTLFGTLQDIKIAIDGDYNN
ncbi:MAG: hypothetical protein M0R17_01965 [Candidatus Omnitrophica bacterium]|jgi:hypothetical protein|nr:hypothetical protein [Candidatus Omnitrophota bacterium]